MTGLELMHVAAWKAETGLPRAEIEHYLNYLFKR